MSTPFLQVCYIKISFYSSSVLAVASVFSLLSTCLTFFLVSLKQQTIQAVILSHSLTAMPRRAAANSSTANLLGRISPANTNRLAARPNNAIRDRVGAVGGKHFPFVAENAAVPAAVNHDHASLVDQVLVNQRLDPLLRAPLWEVHCQAPSEAAKYTAAVQSLNAKQATVSVCEAVISRTLERLLMDSFSNVLARTLPPTV
jgi:hypothetical protein